jgi:5-formyltetrahydrofolate cyclo-ligase
MTGADKPTTRAEIRRRLAGIDAQARAEASGRAAELLLKQPVWQKACCVLLYLPLKDELDLSAAVEAALRSGKTVALPRYHPGGGVYHAAEYRGEPLERKQFGVREPDLSAPEVPLNQLDFLLVPGVAFDRSGRRLGRGKGFYDRLLAGVTGMKCGVAWDEQIVHELRAEPHDIAMDLMLTPSRWADCRLAGIDDGNVIR